MGSELPAVDAEGIRAITGPKGSWAVACGARVRHRRENLGFARSMVCRAADITEMTLIRIEDGRLVPRDYLRLSLAMTLFCEVEDLWPPLTRTAASEMLEAAS